MKRIFAVLVLVFVLTMTGVAGADHAPQHQPLPRTCTAQAFRGFSKAVWDPQLWNRGNPPKNVLEAHNRRLGCAPPQHRAVMKKIWEEDRGAFFVHRHHMVMRERYLPEYGCTDARCGYWAIPAWNVNCESKGGLASGNIYGNQEWGAYGGYRYAGSPEEATFMQQSIVATHLLHAVGLEQGWLQWESGCDGWPG